MKTEKPSQPLSGSKTPPLPAPVSQGDTRPTDAALRRTLEAAAWLEAHQASLVPPPAFLPTSRRRLLERIHSQAPRPWWQSAWARPQLRLALNSAALALLLVALVTFNLHLFTAAQVALPGEALYSFKLGYESTRLAFAFTDTQQAALHVAFARQRSNELQALLLEGDFTYLEITSMRLLQQVNLANRRLLTAQDFDDGQRQQLVQELATTLTMQKLVLQALSPGIPEDSQAVVNFLLLAAH